MSYFGNVDVSESVLYERNQMLENGTVCISFIVNEKMLVTSDIDIFDYGVFNHNDQNILKIYEDIKLEIKNNIYNYFVFRNKTSIDFKETKSLIKKGVTKMFDKALNKRPIVLPTIIDVRDIRNARTSQE